MSIYRVADVDIPFEVMIKLRREGKLSLGLSKSDGLAITSNLNRFSSKKTTIGAAANFWSLAGLAWLIFSVYLSFASAWWWFILGVLGISVVWSANKSGNVQNLLVHAMEDREFYERVRAAKSWQYEMDAAEASRFARTPGASNSGIASS